MIELGSFRNTSAHTVSEEADIFTSKGPHSTFMVVSDRNILLARNSAPIDERAFPLSEGTYARLRLEKNEVLTFALAAGETDGTVYITECS